MPQINPSYKLKLILRRRHLSGNSEKKFQKKTKKKLWKRIPTKWKFKTKRKTIEKSFEKLIYQLKFQKNGKTKYTVVPSFSFALS